MGRTSPASALMRVDLPAPLGPTTATSAPAGNVADTWCTAGWPFVAQREVVQLDGGWRSGGGSFFQHGGRGGVTQWSTWRRATPAITPPAACRPARYVSRQSLAASWPLVPCCVAWTSNGGSVRACSSVCFAWIGVCPVGRGVWAVEAVAVYADVSGAARR
jgi:hypothetical protein